MAADAAIWAGLLGLSVAGFVAGVRALPAVARLVADRKKPWACDYCMCFWGTLIWGAAGWHWYRLELGQHGWFILGPGYAIALTALDKLISPPSAPPPELLREDGEP